MIKIYQREREMEQKNSHYHLVRLTMQRVEILIKNDSKTN
jgi:hypothetical protein